MGSDPSANDVAASAGSDPSANENQNPKESTPSSHSKPLLFLTIGVFTLFVAVILAIFDFASTSIDRGFWETRTIGTVDFEPASIAALIAGVMLLIGVLWLLLSNKASSNESVIAGLSVLELVPLVLTTTIAATIAVYLLPVDLPPNPEQFALDRWNSWERWNGFIALGVGLLLGPTLGVLVALLQPRRGKHQTPDHQYIQEVVRRLPIIEAQLDAWCPDHVGGYSPEHTASRNAACTEAKALKNSLRLDLGLPNVQDASGSGPSFPDRDIVGLWNRLHAAEEALLSVAPATYVMNQGLFDELRLRDARIERAEDLRYLLRRAVAVLGGRDYLTIPPAAPSLDIGVDLLGADAYRATSVLRGIRHTINEYRDSRRAGLIRAKQSVFWTGMLTGATAYAVLGIALLVQVDASYVVAALIFYLVAAMVGMFNQLRLNSRSELEQTEEDFGFARAQLLYLPVLAGLAGVGGVVITAMLFATLNTSIVTYSAPAAASPTLTATSDSVVQSTVTSLASPTSTPDPSSGSDSSGGDGVGGDEASGSTVSLREEGTPPPLTDIFDLSRNQFGLVIAALFGLTPGLLVDRLQGLADRYKADLRSTSAQEGARR